MVNKSEKFVNVAVIGGHKCSNEEFKIAMKLGELIAEEGWILITGGLSGIMEAACKGAKRKGGITVGILPGLSKEDANPYVRVSLPTGIGFARNVLIARMADYFIAIEGKYGTLSEIALALNEGKKVFTINSWDIEGVVPVKSPEEAINRIKKDLKEKEKR